MKLYELPRKSFFRIIEDTDKKIYFFDHIDGMYSICFDREGRIIHLKAFLDIEKVDNPYLVPIDEFKGN